MLRNYKHKRGGEYVSVALILLSRFRSTHIDGVTKENIKRAVTGEGFCFRGHKKEGDAECERRQKCEIREAISFIALIACAQLNAFRSISFSTGAAALKIAMNLEIGSHET